MYNVQSYGAVADGKTLCTAAIQSAIDACAAAGGGRVTVPAGTYKTGTLWLLSGVELHLELGAELLASENFDDYNDIDAYEQNDTSPIHEQWVGKNLIVAHEVENVAITDLGTVNGNCHAFVDYVPMSPRFTWRSGTSICKDPENLRPGQLIVFIECRHAIFRISPYATQPAGRSSSMAASLFRCAALKYSRPFTSLTPTVSILTAADM